MGIDKEATHVRAVGMQLGEGPVWVSREQALWFVDIKGKRLHRYIPTTEQLGTFEAPEQPGFVQPVRGGGFIVGLKSGLYSWDPTSRNFSDGIAVEPHRPQNRLNDATVGPDGALWFGSMDDLETDATGSLFRMAGDRKPVALDGGYVITNGPAFSPDGRIFYHTDTLKRVIYAFDRSSANKLSGKRVFVQIEEGAGCPDGSVVDAEGCLWVALFGGWSVRRYSPKGELLAVVRFPCANVTKIAFGGSQLSVVYATTAWKGLSAAEREAQPQAGDLFSFRTDVPGLPSLEFDPQSA